MFGLTPRRLVYILIIVAIAFLGKQYFPPYFARFQFGDAVRQTVKYAAAAQRNTDIVRREVLLSAEEAGIPITDEDIRIVKRGLIFTVDIDYEWPIDLRIYKHNLNFHISESGEMFEK
jgi:hypothetical protein